MARLSAVLLLILLFGPGLPGAGELARASETGIESVPAAVGQTGHLRSAPGRLLFGGPIFEIESGDVPPLADLPLDRGPRTRHALAARLVDRPCPPGCVPTSQRLPYDATAPPALG